MKVASLSRELKEQKELNEWHKRSYDELVLALTPHIKTSAENIVCTNKPVNQEMQQEIAEENARLKEHIKLLYFIA